MKNAKYLISTDVEYSIDYAEEPAPGKSRYRVKKIYRLFVKRQMFNSIFPRFEKWEEQYEKYDSIDDALQTVKYLAEPDLCFNEHGEEIKK